MASYTKQLLSASINGQPIVINTTSSLSQNTIHTSIASSNAYDEIYIYASNQSLSNIQLTICWGNTGSDNQILSTITPQSGRMLICDGMLLNNGYTVYAYAASTGSVLIDGFVNRIE